jgi:hypothetical protein
MTAAISSLEPGIDALRAPLRPCASSPRSIPCPEITPDSHFGDQR